VPDAPLGDPLQARSRRWPGGNLASGRLGEHAAFPLVQPALHVADAHSAESDRVDDLRERLGATRVPRAATPVGVEAEQTTAERRAATVVRVRDPARRRRLVTARAAASARPWTAPGTPSRQWHAAARPPEPNPRTRPARHDDAHPATLAQCPAGVWSTDGDSSSSGRQPDEAPRETEIDAGKQSRTLALARYEL
jgi:hypothetical protein